MFANVGNAPNGPDPANVDASHVFIDIAVPAVLGIFVLASLLTSNIHIRAFYCLILYMQIMPAQRGRVCVRCSNVWRHSRRRFH